MRQAGTLAGRIWRSRDRLGLLVCLELGVIVGLGWAVSSSTPTDAGFYWQTTNIGHLYGSIWGSGADAYVYPPPFALLMLPLHALGWQLFIVVWTTLLFGAVWAVTRAWSLPILLVAGVPALVLGSAWAGSQVVLLPVIGNIQ